MHGKRRTKLFVSGLVRDDDILCAWFPVNKGSRRPTKIITIRGGGGGQLSERGALKLQVLENASMEK